MEYASNKILKTQCNDDADSVVQDQHGGAENPDFFSAGRESLGSRPTLGGGGGRVISRASRDVDYFN